MSTRDKINISELFVVIGTENYVRSIRDPEDEEHHLITDQIMTAKHLCKPVILLIDTNMDKKDKDYLGDYFKGFKIVDKHPLNHKDDEAAIEEIVVKIVGLLEEEK